MSSDLISLLYLVAAVLFILALRGLSSPVTAQKGNQYGMIGMGVAIFATLAHKGMQNAGYDLIFLGIGIIAVLPGQLVEHIVDVDAQRQVAVDGPGRHRIDDDIGGQHRRLRKIGVAPVNWRAMETEELGSVYESLLELQPHPVKGSFE